MAYMLWRCCTTNTHPPQCEVNLISIESHCDAEHNSWAWSLLKIKAFSQPSQAVTWKAGIQRINEVMDI